MKQKNYDGYKSFDYLEGDYKQYELVDELNRVEPYQVPLSEAEEKRAQKIIEENIIISLHDHPTVKPKNLDLLFEAIREGREFTAFEALSKSGLDAIFDNMMDGTAVITSNAGWKWTDIIHDMGTRFSDLAHQDFIIRCETVADIRYAYETGRLALVPTLEAATPIENELDRIEVLYGLGVRSMGIAYSEGNSLGAGLKEPSDGGLTLFGRRAVERMNKTGILIDVSHCGDQTSLDTIKYSSKPIVASHAGARALWNSARLKPDEVIKALADKGGIIGIEAAPHTTLTKDDRVHTIESYMAHFEYCLDLVGIDHVAFGPDTLYGDHVGLHHAFAEHLSIGASHKALDFEEVEYVKGLENPSECLPNIVRWLVKHNYSDDEIIKVCGGNVMRVLEEVWF